MSGAESAAVSAEGHSWNIGGHTLLDNVSFDVGPGEILGIIGPNGSGKSSLLRSVAGVAATTSGITRLDGVPTHRLASRGKAQRIAFVQQNTETDVDYRVEDVVQLGRIPYRARLAGPSQVDADACAKALHQVGLTGFAKRRWNGLSGGEKQRVHIARAFAQQPSVMLLDEPTNHLDIHHQFQLMDTLSRTAPTVVIVLHDLNLAARYCHRLLLLHEGHTIALGSPREVLTKEHLRSTFRVEADVRNAGNRTVIDYLGSTPYSAP